MQIERRVGLMDMFQTLYFVAIVINSLAYIQSMLIGETDENGEIPKHRKLQEWSYTLMTFYGLLGIINSCNIFEMTDVMTQIICIIHWILLLIGITFQILSLRLEIKKQKKE